MQSAKRRPAFDLWRVAACYGTERPRLHAHSAIVHSCACCSTMHSSKQQVTGSSRPWLKINKLIAKEADRH